MTVAVALGVFVLVLVMVYAGYRAGKADAAEDARELDEQRAAENLYPHHRRPHE